VIRILSLWCDDDSFHESARVLSHRLNVNAWSMADKENRCLLGERLKKASYRVHVLKGGTRGDVASF
jgi:hypothetical protein